MEGLNLLEGIEDYEEDLILKENLDLVSIFNLDIEKIISRYEPKALMTQVADLPQTDEEPKIGQEPIPNDVKAFVVEKTHEYDMHPFLPCPGRWPVVSKEDDLHVNLGNEEHLPIIRVNTKLCANLKAQLQETSYADVFAWRYMDMKGIDP